MYKKDPVKEKKSAKKKEESKSMEPKTNKEDNIKDVEESLFSDVELPKKGKDTSEDEEIGLIEKERQKTPKTRPFSISGGGEGSSTRAETRQIVIRFNPRIMERVSYIGAIVILLLLVIYFATTSGSAPADEEPLNTPEDQLLDADEPTSRPERTSLPEEQLIVEASEEGDVEVSEPAEEGRDQPDEELTPEEIESEVPLTGDVTITITDVQTQTTSYGGKIKSIAFIVDNGDEPFMPKVKIYVYDEESKNERLLAPTIKIFDELGSGKRLIADVKLSGALFSEDAVGTEKTVLIKLFDEGEKIGFANDRLLAKAETTAHIG